MYINGKWIESQDKIKVINPANGKLVDFVPVVTKNEVRKAIDAADKAFEDWSSLSAAKRASYLYKVAELMEKKKDDLAYIATLEMGKALNDMKGEIQSAIDYVQWYAEEAQRVYGETIPSKRNKVVNVIKQPVGVVGAITPWNFPVSMITRKIAPAISVGCTVVLKPSSSSPLSAKFICEIFEEVGIPDGVVNIILGNSKDISNELLENSKVRKMSFTGSTSVGKNLIEGSAKTVKKLSLELGGHAPFIVFEDANIDMAVQQLVNGKFRCSGQACVSMNRIYIQRSIEKEFVFKLNKQVKSLTLGNGLNPETQVGPLVNSSGLQKVENQVNDAISKGANVTIGGKRSLTEEHKNGFFFEPTVLTNVNEEMYISHEETFGPVAPIFTFDTEEEVIKKANNTPFGLASYFYTNDLSRSHRVARKLDFGIVGLNDAHPISASVPFGGIKESGYGKEGGHHGLNEYLIEKLISTVYER